MLLVDLAGAVILGLVEGVTEFIPVSSTAHLILVGDLLGWTGETAKTFEIFIQLGAILAVMWLYRGRVLRLLGCLWVRSERPLAAAILVSFLPAALAGLLLHSYIKLYLFSPLLVGFTLAAGGIAILIVERLARPSLDDAIDSISWRHALGIGLAQCLSLVPGVSRSAATIMGGMALGVPRRAATEYSFFLAIPTMFAATLFDLAKHAGQMTPADAADFAAGFAVAFVSALLIVRGFLKFVQHHSFVGFAWYRIGFGALVVIYYICK
ncbi:MAG: undecaprenyl-diphosphate phosphatase [Acidobacteriota bacterium]